MPRVSINWPACFRTTRSVDGGRSPTAEHRTVFHLTDNMHRRADDRTNPFIDPRGCSEMVNVASREFDEALLGQK
jgi:hypothetical protein